MNIYQGEIRGGGEVIEKRRKKNLNSFYVAKLLKQFSKHHTDIKA